MNFSQRLSRFLVGIFVGVLLSFALFGQKSCTNWFPGNRVKETLFEKRIWPTDDVQCKMDCYGLDRSQVLDLLRQGDVDFGQSDVQAESKKYFLDAGAYDVEVQFGDTANVISKLSMKSDTTCDC